jgi:predicted alpha/beta-hydrolase family hydrolase
MASSVRKEGVPLYLGGKSYGGRIATHIVSDGVEADGLVLLSYPLHPPGKPDRLRDAHLPAIRIPMLFVQGTKDPFATPSLLTKTTRSLPTATLHPIEGGDHSLRVRGRAAADVTAEVTETISRFVG